MSASAGRMPGEPEKIVGIDSEYLSGKRLPYQEEIALVDATTVDLSEFARVLESDTTIVMHSSVQDVEVLLRACNALPAHLFDTQIAAGFAGYNGPSLATLVQGVLGVRLPAVRCQHRREHVEPGPHGRAEPGRNAPA